MVLPILFLDVDMFQHKSMRLVTVAFRMVHVFILTKVNTSYENANIIKMLLNLKLSVDSDLAKKS